MSSKFTYVAMATGIVGILGVIGQGCLDRDVISRPPSTNDTFTTTVHNQTIDKVDLLFMIDNSPSMGDKQTLLALAIPNMLNRLVTPNCLDNTTMMPTGMTADQSGNCPMGSKAEFSPVHDMHIGIVSSSLGSRGGDVCPDNATNPVNPAISAHDNDNGELIARGGVPGMPNVENVPGTGDAPAPLNFLSYFPMVAANNGKMPPPTPGITTGATLVSDFATLIEGVHEHGCGFEAQNEAWYRFLVQPDPFATINKNGNQATLSGIDNTILQQRADFLRPDSLLAIIVVTDENEEAADPLSIGGQGWAFDQTSFPGSQSGGGAPQGTVECQALNPSSPTTTGPNDPNCTSCAFGGLGSNTMRCPKDGASGKAGYLDPSDDAINLRFYHQKERFGLFSGYPTSRYVRGLQQTTVPSVGLAFMGDKDHEHDNSGNYIGDQDSQANCVNPIYAQSLPTSSSSNLCQLQAGPRTADLVYYAAIAGVPHQLLQATPGMGAQKDTLTDADWQLIMGKDPEHYDFSGADFHMVESPTPRTMNTGLWGTDPITKGSASTCAPPAMGKPSPTCDPINGSEFTTNKEDLQFSCIFPLIQVTGGNVAPFQKDCTSNLYTNACDCAATALDNGSQLCDTTTATTQDYAKAYPSVREMIIAHAMSTEIINGAVSNQGIVSSLCPISEDIGMSVAQASADPLFGYNPAVNAIINRLKASLSNQCVPEKLVPSPAADGGPGTQVPCLILASLPAGPGLSCNNPGNACAAAQGLVGPSPDPNSTLPQSVLDKFCSDQESAFTAAGGKTGSASDPNLQPVCAITQLTPEADPGSFSNGSCSTSGVPGWCYVSGKPAIALGCPEGTIVFTNGEPPHGATTNLQCLETTVNVVPDAGAD